MKRKVVKTPAKVVASLNADPDKYYGFVHDSDSTKGFVTREEWMRGPFVAAACSGVTQGNSYGSRREFGFETIHELMESCSRLTFFQFDTHEELFAWLASTEDALYAA